MPVELRWIEHCPNIFSLPAMSLLLSSQQAASTARTGSTLPSPYVWHAEILADSWLLEPLRGIWHRLFKRCSRLAVSINLVEGDRGFMKAEGHGQRLQSIRISKVKPVLREDKDAGDKQYTSMEYETSQNVP